MNKKAITVLLLAISIFAAGCVTNKENPDAQINNPQPEADANSKSVAMETKTIASTTAVMTSQDILTSPEFQSYKMSFEKSRGLSDTNIKNPYALMLPKNTGKVQLPLAANIYSNDKATNANISEIVFERDRISVYLETDKNPQGQKFTYGAPIEAILLTNKYEAAITAYVIPKSKLKPSEATPGKDIYIIEGTTNIGKTVAELLPRTQYLVIAANRN